MICSRDEFVHVIAAVTLIGGPDSRLCLIKRYLTVELPYREKLENTHKLCSNIVFISNEVVISSEWSLSEDLMHVVLKYANKFIY